MVQLSAKITGMLAILSVASTAAALPTTAEHDIPRSEQAAEAGGMVNFMHYRLSSVNIFYR